jgi:hypothetical protein
VDWKREAVREASKEGRGGGAESPSDKKMQMKGKAGTDSSRERAYLGEILGIDPAHEDPCWNISNGILTEDPSLDLGSRIQLL